MKEKILIEGPDGDAVAHWRRGDETWERAANRAVRKLYGKAASAWNWNETARVVNRDGKTLFFIYNATVVGRRTRDCSWPIWGKITTTLYPEEK